MIKFSNSTNDMKVLVALIVLKAVLAVPTGESLLNRIPKNHVPKWELMLDADGNTFLIDANPLENDVSVSPMFNAQTETHMWLYTRRNPENPQILKLGVPDSVQNSYFDSSKPLRIIIHGWNSNRESPVNVLIRRAYLEKDDVNVIVVDWSAGANNIVYFTSRGNINGVSDYVALWIDWMHDVFRVQFANIYVMGHSLGGHTAGLVGKKVKKGRIPRIIALDPAGPDFWSNKPNERLTPDDGEQVEVIHTNGGTLGYLEPIGDLDFYPNGGKSQPGCTLDVVGTCAHGRACELMADSIRNGGLIGRRCGSHTEASSKKCVHDGVTSPLAGNPIASKLHVRGSYYLDTNKNAPFSQ